MIETIQQILSILFLFTTLGTLMGLAIKIILKENQKEKDYINNLNNEQKNLILDYKINTRISFNDFKKPKKQK